VLTTRYQVKILHNMTKKKMLKSNTKNQNFMANVASEKLVRLTNRHHQFEDLHNIFYTYTSIRQIDKMRFGAIKIFNKDYNLPTIKPKKKDSSYWFSFQFRKRLGALHMCKTYSINKMFNYPTEKTESSKSTLYTCYPLVIQRTPHQLKLFKWQKRHIITIITGCAKLFS
jgi:hypothetical protein